jgi:hypothetical protein
LFTRIILVFICACSISSCRSEALAFESVKEVASAAQETETRQVVIKKVEKAINENDFRSLSAMEQEFRTSRSRTPSGVWNLEIFHATLKFYLIDRLVTANECQSLKADFVTQWAAAEPLSPAPIITHAELLTEQAWCYRGKGASTTVSKDDWAKFYNGLQIAQETLESHVEMASVNPHYFAVQATIYRGMGVSESRFQEFLKQATDREPDYPRTYMNAVWYYMPQWGGSYEQVDQFARFAAEKSNKTNGTGMYVRVLWSLESCGCHILEEAANWEILKQSMQDVYVRYPVGWNREYFTKASIIMRQLQVGYEYIKKAHPELTDEETRDIFNKAYNELVLNR